jgi:hypothetical protein
MPRKFERHIEHWRDRHGTMRYYFRKGKGARIPLPDNPDTEEFDAAYQAALAGLIIAKRERREPDKPGTIAALVRSYLRSAA